LPLNLSNRDQNSGHLFYNRRLRAAITRFSVRMKHDDRKQQAAVALSAVLVLIGCGWMGLLHFMKPAGLVGQSTIVGNRDTGALYAKIDDRFYPALNLTSARLATGSSASPTWVTAAEIAKHPTGPMIGIPGLPDELAISGDSVSAWAVCDTASAQGSGTQPTVTAIGGTLTGDRARPMQASQAVLATHRGDTYLIWNGQRTQIDVTDRSVAFNLGLDPGKTRQVQMSTALFDALPATEPLVVPMIPDAGAPSRWLSETVVGRVLETDDANGHASGFYVVLPNGIQKITPFVADLLRTADSQGVTAPQLVAPDKIVNIPQVDVLNVDFYPAGKLEFVDTEANPVTCVGWQKQSGDRRAKVALFSGRGLPTPQSMDSHIVHLVRDNRAPESVEANETLMLPSATNFVVSTSGVASSDTRESLFWVSPQGVRFGVEWNRDTLQALGIDPKRAVQAPWPMLRIFAQGPAITRSDALLARDAIDADGPAAPVAAGQNGGR